MSAPLSDAQPATLTNATGLYNRAAINKLNTQIEKIDQALADGKTYAGPPKRAAMLNKKRTEVTKLIEGAELRWINASEAYDKARSRPVG